MEVQKSVNSLNKSINSAYARKYEEIRQSINIRNSQSVYKNQKHDTQRAYYVEEPDNRQHHMNSLIALEIQSSVATEQDAMQQKQQQEQNANVTNGDNIEKKKLEFAQKEDHKIPLSELKQKYKTDYKLGLTEPQAEQNLIDYGENKLSDKVRVPAWVILLKELTNGFALMLWVSAGLCFLAYGLTPDDPSNLYLAIVLLIVIFVTAFITFQQNAKSEALMKSFKNFLPQKCTVIRNGEPKHIDALKIVVGDIVLIKAGEKIPADIRILESSEMKVDNSPLTGESEPQLRTAECSHPENYLETANMAFFGTLCKEGTGKGVVVSTGDRTTLGQIADLSSGEKKAKTPLRAELDRFVYMVTILGIFLCILFFLLAYLVIGFPVMSCIVFGIGILVANVPEGLLGCITICLAITAKNLARKQVLVKNLEAVETLGSTSCICTDKTGTLTQNVMTVKHIWINDTVFETPNLLHLQKGQESPYDINDIGFKTLQQAAMISSEAVFDFSELKDKNNVDYLKCPVIGDATETGLIRFYQSINDVNSFRSKFKIVKNPDETLSRMPFSSQYKFALTVVEEESENSHYAVYMKGAPEKIWSYCSTVYCNNQQNDIDNSWQTKFKQINLQFGKGGERVLGFAKLALPATQYPKGSHFYVQNPSKFTFQLAKFQFCGLVSLMDPPKPRVPYAILECRSAGIKVIMVTGDQPPTAAAIAKEVNIVPQEIITNEDLMEKNPTLDWFQASEQFTIAYFQMGQLESAAGFIGYYMMFNYFGFPVRELFGLANVSGFTPLKDDFEVHLNPFTNKYDPYFNSELYKAAGNQYDCRVNRKDADSIKNDIDWQKLTDGNYDLRKSLLKCNEKTGEWVPTVNWSDCDTKSDKTWSKVTSQTACYSTEAVKWAQTGFFSSVVTNQWSNVFACKSRKMSFATTNLNTVMLQGIIFETALLCFLLYVPGVQEVFGGRPYEFWMFCHGLFFSICLLLWEETRKYTTRTFKWFFKYAYW
ncbi:hypothetical protein ABPG73_000081 [Tetrahymena malaccensis]